MYFVPKPNKTIRTALRHKERWCQVATYLGFAEMYSTVPTLNGFCVQSSVLDTGVWYAGGAMKHAAHDLKIQRWQRARSFLSACDLIMINHVRDSRSCSKVTCASSVSHKFHCVFLCSESFCLKLKQKKKVWGALDSSRIWNWIFYNHSN